MEKFTLIEKEIEEKYKLIKVILIGLENKAYDNKDISYFVDLKEDLLIQNNAIQDCVNYFRKSFDHNPESYGKYTRALSTLLIKLNSRTGEDILDGKNER